MWSVDMGLFWARDATLYECKMMEKWMSDHDVQIIMMLIHLMSEWDTQPIHKQMTVEELNSLFGCQSELDVPDYEIIPLPTGNPQLHHFNFTVFGRLVSLEMKPNDLLLSGLRMVVRGNDRSVDIDPPASNCHYIHSDGTSAAAFSSCGPQGLHGWIFLEDDTLEVRPLTPRLHDLLKHPGDSPLAPYLVKRAPFIDMDGTDEIYLPEGVEIDHENTLAEREELQELYERPLRSSSRPVVEVALFFDEAGYKIFSPYMQNDDKQMRDMLLAYMNGVQALYHHPSVGQPVDIALVRLEIFKSQPADLPHYGGERGGLLDSFCAFNAKHNPPGDSDPAHWDMGLYVSGLDFYAIEGGRRSDVTMGLATVGGVCMDKYACVIAELGTTNSLGKPYPSAGFTSVYILAHEMGHNLGMHHDSSSNSCPSEGYIMSPSRGTQGETLWSTCSAQVMQTLSEKKCLEDSPAAIPAERNHERMHDHPGQLWGAKRQCEVLLRDKDAELQDPSATEGMCQNLQCKTPHRSGYYFAGPALEGTACLSGKWCQGGQCVVMEKQKPEKVVKGGWSKWTTEECASGCIAKSKGYHTKHRQCNNPAPVNTEEGCEGASFEVELCKDDKICKKIKRVNPADYARKKCAEFSQILPILDSKGSGLQAPHEEGRLWVACSIFCRRKDNGSYYSPRFDLNDLGTDPYFPDGTWCHHNSKHNYYCMNHHCHPENFRGAKSLLDMTEDLQVPQNAPSKPLPLPDLILRYLSLDPEGKPLLTSLTAQDTPRRALDDGWDSRDYLDLPQPM